MPLIEDLNNKKPFKKVSYRPWALGLEEDVQPSQNTSSEKSTDSTTDISANISKDTLNQTYLISKDSTEYKLDTSKALSSSISKDRTTDNSADKTKDNSKISLKNIQNKSTSHSTKNKSSLSKDKSADTSRDRSTDTNTLSTLSFPHIPTSIPVASHSISKDRSADESADKSTDNRIIFQKVRKKPLLSRDTGADSFLEKVGTKLRTEVRTDSLPIKTFSELSKLSQNILQVVLNSCLENMSNITGKLSIHLITTSVSSTEESVKRTIRRLSDLGIILKTEYQDGRGGWTKYQLHKDIYIQMMTYKSRDKTTDRSADVSKDKVGTQVGTNLSNSNSINKNTTIELGDLPQEWEDIDILPLDFIRFTKTHLAQIYKSQKLTPEEVQDSINAFAFDLKENGKKTDDPMRIFMGILIKNGVPYTPPTNYISPKDSAIKAYLEHKKLQKEKRKALEEEAFHLEFEEWRESLTIEQEQNFIPDFIKQKKDKLSRDDWEEMALPILRDQFTQSIWKDKRLEIFGRR